MTPPIPSRGDVWFADVPTDKRRPVLVLTREPMGRILERVICAPITSHGHGLSTEVSIGPEAGLDHESVISLDNIVLLHRSRLIRRLGRASLDTVEGACEALAIAIGCD